MKTLLFALLLTTALTACDKGSPTDATPETRTFEVAAQIYDADSGRPLPAGTLLTVDFSVDGDSEIGVVTDADGWTKIVPLQIIGDTDPQKVTLTIRAGINYGTSAGLYPLTWEYNPRAGRLVQSAKVGLRRVP